MKPKCIIPSLACTILMGKFAFAEQLPVAVFDIAFVNYSQEIEYGATNEAEKARALMLSAEFRKIVESSGRYVLVDTAPAGNELALHGNPFGCNDCDAQIAANLGAERSFSGAVQKLSNLVQTIIIRERDTRTGDVLAQYQTDIRGNTDEAWLRGLRWLMKNRMLPGTAELDVN